MKTKIDFEILSATDFVKAVVNLVWSADRAMPAHFTSNGKRTQSFCIDFDDIDSKDEYQMASVAYNEIGDFIKPEDNLTQEQHVAVLRCGEDIMISSYIAQKLNRPETIKDIVIGITEMSTTSWPENFEVSTAFGIKDVKKWFKYCMEYGVTVSNR